MEARRSAASDAVVDEVSVHSSYNNNNDENHPNIHGNGSKKRSRSPTDIGRDVADFTNKEEEGAQQQRQDKFVVTKKLIVSDLTQSVEWIVTMVHDDETATDVAEFAVNGVWSMAVEERLRSKQ